MRRTKVAVIGSGNIGTEVVAGLYSIAFWLRDREAVDAKKIVTSRLHDGATLNVTVSGGAARVSRENPDELGSPGYQQRHPGCC